MGLPINFDPSQEPPRGSKEWSDNNNTFVVGPYYDPIIDEYSGLEVTPEGYLRTCGGGGGGISRLFPGPGIQISGLASSPTISNNGVIGLCAGPGILITCANGVYTISDGTVGPNDAQPKVRGEVFALTQSTPSFNTAIGYGALEKVSSGTRNVAIGCQSGCALTTESNNVVVGNHPGLIAKNNHLLLADGASNLRVVINNCGALSSEGSSFGTSGQFLTSAGPSKPFYWSNLPAASATQAGAVRFATIGETRAGTCGTIALTPVGGEATYIKNATITAKGQLIAGTGVNTYTALPAGPNGYVLSPCSLCTNGLTWCQLPTASTTQQGLIRLASVPETEAGVDSAIAITPVGGEATYIKKSTITGKGQLIAGTSPSNYTALPPGPDGSILTACGSSVSGMVWCSLFSAKGQILAGTGGTSYTALPAGINGQTLVANSDCPSGLQWTRAYGDTPVGAINWFASSTPPDGWLVADGSVVSRTTYADLFSIIGTTYGAGDGSTTFQLPDLRGQFLRGWDSAGGTARGCDPGRAFGSNQGCAFMEHGHFFADPGHEHQSQPHCHTQCFIAYNTGGAAGDCVGWALNNGDRGYLFGDWQSIRTTAPTQVDTLRSFTGGRVCGVCPQTLPIQSEVRPMNVALLPCIKWQVTYAPPLSPPPVSCVIGPNQVLTMEEISFCYVINPVNTTAGYLKYNPVGGTVCLFGQVTRSTGANDSCALTNVGNSWFSLGTTTWGTSSCWLMSYTSPTEQTYCIVVQPFNATGSRALVIMCQLL